jgi:hypothetical protein
MVDFIRVVILRSQEEHWDHGSAQDALGLLGHGDGCGCLVDHERGPPAEHGLLTCEADQGIRGRSGPRARDRVEAPTPVDTGRET